MNDNVIVKTKTKKMDFVFQCYFKIKKPFDVAVRISQFGAINGHSLLCIRKWYVLDLRVKVKLIINIGNVSLQ